MGLIYLYRIYLINEQIYEFIWTTTPPQTSSMNTPIDITQTVVLEQYDTGSSNTIGATQSPYNAGNNQSINANTQDGNITINLPDASLVKGKIYFINKQNPLNQVIVDGFGSQTIDGSLTKTMTGTQTLTIISDGTNWSTNIQEISNSDAVTAIGPLGPTGPIGSTGATGPRGITGQNFISGNGTPSYLSGNTGDSYLDTNTGEVYQKTGAGWITTGGNLKGATGSNGQAGSTGATGNDGQAGATGKSFISGSGTPSPTSGNTGDSYLDTNTGEVYQKTGTGWTSTGGNLRGATGATGNDGQSGATGKSFISGSGTPSPTSGNTGDSYLDTNTGEVYQKTGTGWTSTGGNLRGATGATGGTGFNFLSGTGVPSPTDGNTGDSYLDVLTGEVYKKTDSGWVLTGGNLKGNTGETGATGATGFNFLSGTGVPSPTDGNNGDSYLDVLTGEVYKKTDSGWVLIGGSLKGNTGVTGATGATGFNFLSGTGAPSPTDGNIGDSYLDVLTGEVYKKTDSGWVLTGGSLKGNTGDTGATGATGFSFLSGSGAPSPTDGNIGDSYMDVVTGDIYKKTISGWTLIGGNYLVGLTGATGVTGAGFLSGSGIPNGTEGATGDSYLDVLTGEVYKKIITGWTLTGGSLRGATGETGATGATGFSFLSGSGAPSPTDGNTGDSYMDVVTGDIYKKTISGWTLIGGNYLVGPTGATGWTGATGNTGSVGPIGPTGPKGEQGGGGGLVYYMNYDDEKTASKGTSFYGLNTNLYTLTTTTYGPYSIPTGTSLSVGLTSTVGFTGIQFATVDSVSLPQVISAGLWDMNIYANASAANDLYLQWKLYLQSGATTTYYPTLLATSAVEYITASNQIDEYKISAYVPTTIVPTSSKLLVELIAGNSSATNARDLSLYFQKDLPSHIHSTIGITGPAGPVGATGPTGPTGAIGPTGPAISSYPGLNYRETTTLSYVQNNGTPYYKVSAFATNELGTILSVPNVAISYIGLVYFTVGTPDVRIDLVSFDGTTGYTGPALVAPATDPTIREMNITPALRSSTPRAFRLLVNGNVLSGSSYINIRTIVLGFN